MNKDKVNKTIDNYLNNNYKKNNIDEIGTNGENLIDINNKNINSNSYKVIEKTIITENGKILLKD